MNKVFGLVAIALVAFVSGSAIPNNGTMLTLGSATIGAMPIVLDPTTPYGLPELYYVYLPINTKNITISFSQDPSCSSLQVFTATETYPCGSDYPFDSSSPYFYCYSAGDSLSSSGNFIKPFFAGDSDGSLGSLEFQVVQGGYLYFAVKRYYSSDNSKICPFQIRVDADLCPSGEVAVGDGTDSVVCTTYTNVSTTTQSFSGSFSKRGGNTDYVYRLTLPDFTGNVHIQVAANDSFYVYGLNRQIIRNSYFYGGCYSSGSASSPADLSCTSVETGNYYVYIYSGNDLSGSINITYQVCNPAVGLGPYCNNSVVDLSGLFTNGAVNFTTLPGADAYGCVDLNAAKSLINDYYFVGIVANSSSPDLSFVRGAFPGSYAPYFSYTQTLSTSYSLVISPIDTFGPYDSNIMCFLFEASSSVAVSGQLRVNGTNTPPPTTPTTGMMPPTPTTGMMPATPTTGMMPPTPTTGMMPATPTTGMMMTTGLRATTAAVARATTGSAAVATSTSGVMAVVPAFVVALFALLF